MAASDPKRSLAKCEHVAAPKRRNVFLLERGGVDFLRKFVGRNRMGRVVRRQFLIAAGVLFAAPLTADAQQSGKVYRIGWLQPARLAPRWADGFREGLRDLGYVEGKNLIIEYRWADGRFDRLPDLAGELVRLNVDVIVSGNTTAVLAIKQVTTKIPVVMLGLGDPIATGVVDSLARPGRNVTGVIQMSPILSAKRLEVLKETVPRLSRAAVFSNSANPQVGLTLKETEAAARALSVSLLPVDVRHPGELEGAFSAILDDRIEALILLPDSMHHAQRRRIIEFAARQRLPSISAWREFAEDGGLMVYGPDISDLYRRGAAFVDKILKGSKPGDLPIEQPTKFEFIINLKTAKAIGLTIPPPLLLRADQVIE